MVRVADNPRPCLNAAVWPDPQQEDIVAQACEAAAAFAAEGGELLVLPELFCFEEGTVDDAEVAAEAFQPVVRALCESLRGTGLHVVTSLVETVEGRFFHTGVLLGHAGIVARQLQLHACERHPWATLGTRHDIFRMPYGQLALLVGDDVRYPELARAFDIEGAQVLENRLCVVAVPRLEMV